MDVQEFLSSFKTIDLVLFLMFLGFFVLGFAQGTIRRVIGILSILFSFFLAANIAGPLGEFLGDHWTQFDPHYSYMIGFLTVFVAAALAFALVIQSFYKPQTLFEKARFVDEIIGGILGVIQFGIILGAIVVILDSFFRLQGIPVSSYELPFLRNLWTALDESAIVAALRTTFIPMVFSFTGFLVPDTIEAMYPRPGS